MKKALLALALPGRRPRTLAHKVPFGRLPCGVSRDLSVEDGRVREVHDVAAAAGAFHLKRPGRVLTRATQIGRTLG
jgi:hypothetical protein